MNQSRTEKIADTIKYLTRHMELRGLKDTGCLMGEEKALWDECRKLIGEDLKEIRSRY